MSKKYTFFVHMNATRAWLALSREERSNYFDILKAEIFSLYPAVAVRFYDVEAFSSLCSDIAVYETDQIEAYYFLIDALRDSKVYSIPYFEIVNIFPSIENGFLAYEESLS